MNPDQKESILSYYDQLAKEYDQDRFENSYGVYLNSQERNLLSKWLRNQSIEDTLDVGCGTGRLLDFAKSGVDFSKNMLSEASKKYPDRQLFQSDISSLPFKKKQFKSAFSFHVFMHLDVDTVKKSLDEVHRILEKGGLFIFDFPNQRRRKAINYTKGGWHGNTALDLKILSKMIEGKWSIQKSAGFLLFPIHRFPKSIRKYLCGLDSVLSRTFLKHFASYYCVCLVKQENRGES